MEGWLLRWHQLGGAGWLHLALALAMAAAGWVAAARRAPPWARALHWLAGFCALEALALLLFSLGAALGSRPVLAVGVMLVVPAYAVLWRAGFLLGGLHQPAAEQWAVALGGGALVLLFGLGFDNLVAARSLSWMFNGYVAIRGAMQGHAHLRAGGQARTGLALLALGLATGVPLVALGLDLLVHGGDWSRPSPGLAMGRASELLHGVTTITAMGMNILAAYHVFGRTLHALARLRQAGAGPGLLPRQAVEQALHRATARPGPAGHGAGAAVAALCLQGWSRQCKAWGRPLAEAVQHELALLLRLRLQPGELLAQGGDGVLLLAMDGVTEARAGLRLEALRQAVAADDTLDPGGGPALQLCAELVLVTPGADPVAVVQDVAERCQTRAG